MELIMNITEHFKRNIYDTLINYNLDKNVYDVTLTYEHSNNFLLFNRIESLIVLFPKVIHYSNILQAQYIR